MKKYVALILVLALFAFATIAFAEETGNTWTLAQYVDDFNDPTGESYIATTLAGTFTNSATNDSELTVKVIYDLKFFQIALKEYGQNTVGNSSTSSKNYVVSIKDDDGTVYQFEGFIYSGGDRIFLFSNQNSKLLDLIDQEGTLKFSITDNSSRYNFTLNAGGFNAANDELLESSYLNAMTLMDGGKFAQATLAFSKVGEYKDAHTLSQELYSKHSAIISAGQLHSVGLKQDGTVIATGANDYKQCNVSNWSDIIAIEAGAFHTLGLKSDGTVVATGVNDGGQCDVSGWTDIVAISAGGYHSLGLKLDGTVIAAGSNLYGQCDVDAWTDIVAISAGQFYSLGLKSDGTVVATGDNDGGQCDVSGWTDIVAISAGRYHSLGLKADGTVIAAGNNNWKQSEVKDWTDIVAISANTFHSVGLKSDGTVVSTPVTSREGKAEVNFGQGDVSDWTDIVAISAGTAHTVGLKVDGTVVATEFRFESTNDYGQCDVSEWTDILVPERLNEEGN